MSYTKEKHRCVTPCQQNRPACGWSPNGRSVRLDIYALDPEVLPDSYVIFITEHDVRRHGRPIYLFHRRIGQLMHDFRCTSAREMHSSSIEAIADFLERSMAQVEALLADAAG